MKKILSLICVISTLICNLTLTGCGKPSQGFSASSVSIPSDDIPQNTSLVLGVHQYFPSFSLESDLIQNSVAAACYTYGRFSAVCVDGDPYMVCDYNINPPDAKIDKSKRRQLATANAKQLMNELSVTAARTSETDTLSAIMLAARTLQSTNDDCNKNLIIIDNGLCTTGLLDMTCKDILNTSADNIVSQLDSLHSLPDLNGVSVTWIGLGQTIGEQGKMPNDSRYKLRALWDAILTASGTTAVFNDSPLADKTYEGELPACKKITFVSESLDVAEISNTIDNRQIYKWDEDTSVNFKGDMAEFINPEAAMEALTPFADYLIQSGEIYYLAGMTATVGGPEDGIALSIARAEAVKTVLVSLGVDSSQLKCLGLGHKPNALRVCDRDDNGSFIENEAKKNRAVFLIHENNELVPSLLAISEVI